MAFVYFGMLLMNSVYVGILSFPGFLKSVHAETKCAESLFVPYI